MQNECGCGFESNTQCDVSTDSFQRCSSCKNIFNPTLSVRPKRLRLLWISGNNRRIKFVFKILCSLLTWAVTSGCTGSCSPVVNWSFHLFLLMKSHPRCHFSVAPRTIVAPRSEPASQVSSWAPGVAAVETDSDETERRESDGSNPGFQSRTGISQADFEHL